MKTVVGLFHRGNLTGETQDESWVLMRRGDKTHHGPFTTREEAMQAAWRMWGEVEFVEVGP